MVTLSRSGWHGIGMSVHSFRRCDSSRLTSSLIAFIVNPSGQHTGDVIVNDDKRFICFMISSQCVISNDRSTIHETLRCYAKVNLYKHIALLVCRGSTDPGSNISPLDDNWKCYEIYIFPEWIIGFSVEEIHICTVISWQWVTGKSPAGVCGTKHFAKPDLHSD